MRKESKALQAVLNRLGYKLHVTHVRETTVPKMTESGPDFFLSRSSYYDGIREKSIDTTLPFGSVTKSRGGFTYVDIVRPDGTFAFGKYNFGNNVFVKSVGLYRAVMKAISKEIKNELSTTYNQSRQHLSEKCCGGQCHS